jgi:hypothetical protein
MKGSVLDSEATIYICSWSINFSAREKLLLKLHAVYFCLCCIIISSYAFCWRCMKATELIQIESVGCFTLDFFC